MRRSIAICLAPEVALPPDPPDLPRSFFRSAIGPLASPDMVNRPSRVSFITSPADMQQTIASQASRRAARAGMTARM